MNQVINVGWKVSSLRGDLASVRYRAVMPSLALDPKGIRSHIFSTVTPRNIEGIDVLVLVKTLKPEDIAFSALAAQKGIPVVFDLCDNIFVSGYERHTASLPSEVFLMISNVISAVVVPTEPLAEIVRQKTQNKLPVFVVPDGIETAVLTDEVLRRIRIASLKESSTLRKVQSLLLRTIAKVWEQLRSGNIFMLSANSPRGLIALLNQLANHSRKKATRLEKKLIKVSKQWAFRFRSRLVSKMHLRYWLRRLHQYFALRYSGPSHPPLSPFDSSTFEQSRIYRYADSKEPRPLKSGMPGLQQILWFGNHGAAHAKFGMLDLLEIREALERLSIEMSVELVVVSNNYKKYLEFIAPFAISSRYLEWSPDVVARQLRSANLVIVPNSLDEFSLCKSANRTVTALYAGVPVVATRTPALVSLQECVEFDDFYEGIKRYLLDSSYARRHIEKARIIIDAQFGQHMIGEHWSPVINYALKASKCDRAVSAELIIVLNLVQDTDLAMPILRLARSRGLNAVAWCSASYVNRSHYALQTLHKLEIPWRVMPDSLEGIGNPFPSATSALLSVETNLRPHRFAFKLTKLARANGIRTYTIQHGFENVGLTYDDKEHPIRRVQFASDQIFVWGSLEMLHPQIEQTTRAKCVPVGCPKPALLSSSTTSMSAFSGKTVVGIFENLHWQRYSNIYREFFIEGVCQVAKKFPDVTFALKPHNAGLWLTKRFKGELPKGNNIMIIDPLNKDWKGLTALQLMGYLRAVITSPSTVALDSARAGIPVAVVAGGLSLENYLPLTLLSRTDDWSKFVHAALDSARRSEHCKIAADFAQRVILSGNAAERILDALTLKNVV